jgi:type I restriction enzyme M protein
MNKAGNKLLDSRDKELLFLERCFQFLKPGGKLAILLHVGVLANKGTAWIREWYRDQGRLRGVIQLPNYTFTPYGAKGIETCVLLFEKWPSVSQRDDYPVFYGTIEDIGYTADGRVSRNPKYLGYLQDLYDSSIPPEEKQLDEIEEIVMAFHSEVGWDS